MIICGIDPGLKGGLAFLDTDKSTLVVTAMPTFEKNSTTHVDADGLAEVLLMRKPNIIVGEAVFSSPQMGVSSSFSFGRSKGIIEGAVATLRPKPQFILVTPSVWKKAMGVPADKGKTILRATSLMPDCASFWKLKKNDGVAEAALLALYGVIKSGIKLTKIIPGEQ